MCMHATLFKVSLEGEPNWEIYTILEMEPNLSRQK
jgi:hypothetical protein